MVRPWSFGQKRGPTKFVLMKIRQNVWLIQKYFIFWVKLLKAYIQSSGRPQNEEIAYKKENLRKS